MSHIFVSYSRIDSKKVNRLILKLQQSGYPVWVDRINIEGGDQWRKQIVDAIEKASVFIVVLSQNAISSENVRKELDIAESSKKQIIPIEITKVEIPSTFEYQLAGIQRISFYNNFDLGFSHLTAVLEKQKSLTRFGEDSSITNTIKDKIVQRKTIKKAAIIFLIVGIISVIAYYSFLNRTAPIDMTVSVTQTTEFRQTQVITSTAVLQDQVNPTTDPFECTVIGDDFSQVSRWGDEELTWGGWSHEYGEYNVRLYSPYSLVKKCDFCDSFTQKNFQISVRARTPYPRGSWGIYFWGRNETTYSFELDEFKTASIKQYNGFDSITLASQHNIDLLDTNQLTVEYLNGKIRAYINGEQVLNISLGSPFTDGYYDVGLIYTSFSSSFSEVFFDDFYFSGCP